MSLSKVKSQLRLFFEAWYPADLEKSQAVSPEKVANIDELASDLKGEAD